MPGGASSSEVAAASFGSETQGDTGRCRWSGPFDPVGPPDGWQVLGRALPADHDIWVATTSARDDRGHRITVTQVAVRVGSYIVATEVRPLASSQPEDGQLEVTTRLAVTAAVRLGGRETVR